ncbi:nose resistant to fluoxetine protein 6-like [Centruroides sculpturatus]|uniref:nose resistant to fluoxetine protein 6-like n=1 Tax=Centruroides sculpturatus TaxID=218467 RepID=UPI000C6CBDC3|nr:nose resistant to fluoxetine protein 6-like [Centruroides sculpturatus]
MITDYFLHVYERPQYTHLSSYCLGMLIGCTVRKKIKIKFSKIFVTCCWIVTSIFLGYVCFGLHSYVTDPYPNQIPLRIHQILSPFLWIASIIWILVACYTGHGGILNKFLSLDAFVILDRLVAWMYILNSVIILYVIGEIRSPIPMTEINLILDFMKRFGKMPLGISFAGYFFVKKTFFIKLVKLLYSIFSSLLQLRGATKTKNCVADLKIATNLINATVAINVDYVTLMAISVVYVTLVVIGVVYLTFVAIGIVYLTSMCLFGVLS